MNYNIDGSNHLHIPDVLQSEILEEKIQELKGIRRELLDIEKNVVNRSYARNVFLAPKIFEKLNKIASWIAMKDDMRKLLGTLGTSKAEHHSNCAQIFNELKSMASSSPSH